MFAKYGNHDIDVNGGLVKHEHHALPDQSEPTSFEEGNEWQNGQHPPLTLPDRNICKVGQP
jgi:hypothetical protein